MALQIRSTDPQGCEALALLHVAALEARQLYADLFAPDGPMPTNEPLAPRAAYLLAFEDGRAMGCGALRPLDDTTAEVRRMFVLAEARRRGVARTLLQSLEERARYLGYRRLRLETGCRQAAAIALYEGCGFVRIPPFGPYVADPTSVCFEKPLTPQARPASAAAAPPAG